MSNWNGRHGRGAMKAHRAVKRDEAVARNAAAQPVSVLECGHKHGAGRSCTTS